jgi:GT2 family glycosyltransferase
VVIATRNRSRLLKSCLDSISRQAGLPKGFRVFVVDNSARADPAVKSLCSSPGYSGLAIHYVHHPKPGISEARNRGAGLATTEYIGFIDDDAVLPKSWLEGAFRIQDEVRPDVYGGPFTPTYLQKKPAWFKDEYASGTWGQEARWLEGRQYLFGANIVIKRSLFIQLGGFNPVLGAGTDTLYGEETDFQHRAAQQGGRIWYDPALTVQHLTSPAKMNVRWFIKSSWGHGKAKARIYFVEADPKDGMKLLDARPSWLRRAASRAFQVLWLTLQLPFRSRTKYPFYQNFIIERICPNISGLGMLAGLIGQASKRSALPQDGVKSH